jgi:acetyltransferase-like isoleucine patch superfamily enzyme
MAPKIKYLTFGVRWLRARLSYQRLYTLAQHRKFARLDSLLDPRVQIKNPQCIEIGKNVLIQPYTWLCAMVNDLPRINVFHPEICIGNDVSIGRFCQITISNRLVVEDEVLITEGVLITDSIHGYLDVDVSVIKQPLISLGPIVIGKGSWICNGARIVGKVRIGRHCVIGANTYVDKDVPDYCVVVDSPCRIVKRYDQGLKQWISTDILL